MELKLKAERREGTGKGGARKVRAAGRVPGVVYGHGGESTPISVDARELSHLLHTDAGQNVLVQLKVDGEQMLAMPRDVQRDHLRGRYLHVDFLRIAKDEQVTVEVPVQVVGDSRGVREGGLVEHHMWSLQVACLPQDVPSAIEADIAGIGLGESLHVRELKVDGKITILTPADEVILAVVPPQAMRAAEVAEAVEAGEAAEGAEAAAETEPAGSEEG